MTVEETLQKLVEHHRNESKKAAAHHTGMAEKEIKISKTHAAIAQQHTNQVLAQGHRDLSDYHAAKAEHHTAFARHHLDQDEKLSPLSNAELINEHSDAGDQLMDAADADLYKRFGIPV